MLRYLRRTTLVGQRKDYDRAEEYYQKALAADPNHAITFGNYANFLAGQRKDYDRAEEYYQKAIAADPNHANNLANYAELLVLNRPFEIALDYLRRVAALPVFHDEPNDSVSILWMSGAMLVVAGESITAIVGSLKGVVTAADYESTWNYDDLNAWVEQTFINSAYAAFWIAVGRVCGNVEKVTTLDVFPQWRDTPPMPIEAGLRAASGENS